MSTYEINTLIAYYIQAFAAAATLVTAIVAYNRFLTQRLVTNQFDLVIDLIGILNKTKFRFELVDKTIEGGPGSYALSFDNKNIFELAILASINDENITNVDVYTTSDHKLSYSKSPFEYLSNPLLPSAIANSMQNMRLGLHLTDINFIELPKYILLGEKQDIKRPDFMQTEIYKLEGGIMQYASLCRDTTTVIIDWLSKNGVEDINKLVVTPESNKLFFSPFSI